MWIRWPSRADAVLVAELITPEFAVLLVNLQRARYLFRDFLDDLEPRQTSYFCKFENRREQSTP